MISDFFQYNLKNTLFCCTLASFCVRNLNSGICVIPVEIHKNNLVKFNRPSVISRPLKTLLT